MKILWISNANILNAVDNGTGSWLLATAQALTENADIELANITFGKGNKVKNRNSDKIQEWIIPANRGVSSNSVLLHLPDVINIIDGFSPDLIHIWGTESLFGLITARKYVTVPSLLEMQGLRSAIAKVYFGGLTLREQLACVSLKEILKASTLFRNARIFHKWSAIEKEIISGHRFISVQTQWIESQVKSINHQSTIFHNSRLLRKPFYTSRKWQPVDRNVIFCSISYPSPFKGLHVALRAISILKKRFPDISLRIAGLLQKPGIRQDGYIRWINQQIERLDIRSNVIWLGGLDAYQIIQEMLNANVMVLPTFIENCSNTLQEAMMVGIPVVASYVGGLPSLAKDEESILFFSPGDEAMCAFQLQRFITDKSLLISISEYSIDVANKRNDLKAVVNKQVEIYKFVSQSREV